MKLKSLIPIWLKYILKSWPAFFYDFHRYYKNSGFKSKNPTRESLVARIIHDYHIIEKGLTMPETRLGFGQNKLLDLIGLCKQFVVQYGYNESQVQHAVQVILEYELFHLDKNYLLSENILNEIISLKEVTREQKHCNQIVISKDDYFKYVDYPFSDFSNSRKSVRNYSLEELSIDRIIKAIDLVRNTPSACNRQTARLYVYTDKKKINNILEIQGGNRGFGHLTDKLIVITSNLSVFFEINERYQAYIDGGMFAMNLLYSLHAEKIAACILNCSHSSFKDRRLRRVCQIAEEEVFIAMVSCGVAPDNFSIALSPRYPIEKFARIIS